VGNLVNDFIAVWNDGVKFLEGLETFIVVVEPLVDKTEIVDGLNAVGFDTDCLQEELLGPIVVLSIVQAVTLVPKCL